jgi:hypothetical protein
MRSIVGESGFRGRGGRGGRGRVRRGKTGFGGFVGEEVQQRGGWERSHCGVGERIFEVSKISVQFLHNFTTTVR